MKKTFLYCLPILILFNTNFFGQSFAQPINESHPTVISLESIQDMVYDHNIDLKIAHNKLEKAKEDYDNILDDIDDLENSIRNANKKISDLKLTQSDLSDLSDTTSTEKDITNLQALIKSSRSTLDELEDKRDLTKYEIKTLRLKNNLLAKDLVLNAQQQYINLLNITSNKSLLQHQLELANYKNNINNYSYSFGFLSKNEYDSISLDSNKFQDELTQITLSENINLNTFKNTLGISENETLELSKSMTSDLSNISNIDFQSDTLEMLDNNLDIRIKKIELDSTDDLSDSDYEVDNAEFYLDKEVMDAKLKFQKQYALLTTSYNSFITNYNSLNNLMNDFNSVLNSYNNGFTSKINFQELSLNLDNEIAKVNNERNELYLNYMKYIQMKSGY